MPTEPLRYSWGPTNPLPRLALRPSERMLRRVLPEPAPHVLTGPVDAPFDFSAAMHDLCVDIVAKCPPLAHIDPTRILFTIIKARNDQRHGLQARVTPLRCRGGGRTTMRHRRTYQIQTYCHTERELLYLVTFCLPRFHNRTFAQKLVTVFHELYHISPACNGDLRYFEGRYETHTADQKEYDARVARFAEHYLRNGADATKYAFLEMSFWQLCRRHGTVVGYHVPRPKLLPVDQAPAE